MICPICSRWCARTEAELANRLANMSRAPDAKPFECPQCGGGDWATSRDMIKEPAPEAKPKWWMRLFFPKGPPSWRTLRIVNFTFAFFWLGVACYVDNKVLVVIDAFVAGFNLASALHATQMIRLMESFAAMRAAFNAMVQINEDLLHARIASLTHADRDDDTPIAPKLH